MQTLNTTCGILNFLLLAIMTVYMAISIIRKHRMTRFQWICLCNLWFAVAIVAIGQVWFNSIESDFCNFSLKIIYGIDTIILFNLSTIVCFKAKCVCHDIYEFAINGNLPSLAVQRKKKIVIALIWACSVCYMLVYLILSSIFVFDNQNLVQFDKLNFSAICI